MRCCAKRFLVKVKWLSVGVMALALINSHAAGQCGNQKLLASDGELVDQFGISVSISGDVAIVGVRGDDDNGSSSGSVYIYRFNGVSWVEEDKLLASDGASFDNFGDSVSISGDVAIVGAQFNDDNGADSGSVYIYRFDGASWIQDPKLLASNGAAGDHFGNSVSISGALGNEVVIVGAHGGNGGFGSAYIYRKSGEDWVEEQELFASNGRVQDTFGYSVSISSTPGNEIAFVGANNHTDNHGSGLGLGYAYVYRYNGANWGEETQLFYPPHFVHPVRYKNLNQW